MKNPPDISRQEQFLQICDEYKNIIAKVCTVFAKPSSPFADLYQEVMINLWTGLNSFRGDSKMSTWIYRIALNACISCQRLEKKNPLKGAGGLDMEIPEPTVAHDGRLQQLHSLINCLDTMEKTIITLWLDDSNYEEIALITGLSKANVATRLHRIRQKLSNLANR